MVAAHTHHSPIQSPIRSLDGPMSLHFAGETRLFISLDGIFDAIRKLEQHEKSHNLKAAYAAFHLGQALLVAKDALRYEAMNHLYTDAGINRRRAQRAVKWASAYATPDGQFDLEKYRLGELAARNRHESGDRPCKFDEQNRPSLTAVQEATGFRAAETPKAKSEPALSIPFDPFAELNAMTSDHVIDHAIDTPSLSLSSNEWAAGDQLAIDFDLMATERKLAEAIVLAERAHADGDMSDEQAATINEALNTLAEQVIEITNLH